MNANGAPRSRPWARWACVGVSALVLGLVFYKVDRRALFQVFARLNIWWFLGASLSFLLGYAFAAGRWHVILRLSGNAVHFRATLQSVISGHFFNTLFFGPAGGDIAKATVYSKWYRFPVPAIMATCFLDRLLGGIGFLLLALCTPGLAAYGGHFSTKEKNLPVASHLWPLLGIGILVVAIGFFLHRRLRLTSFFQGILHNFLGHGAQLIAAPKQAVFAIGCAFLSHVCMSGMLLLCLQAVVQKPFSLSELLWTFPVISLISSAPLTFAGAGLREGAALVLLGMYGIPQADAVAAALLVLVTYLIWAFIAGAILWRAQRKQDEAQNWVNCNDISVVIPVLNEEDALPDTLARARAVPEISEIIIVDGGSTDGTRAIAEKFGCRVLSAPRGRGGQMRMGTSQAKGGVVLLLHADTWLPPESGQAVLNCMRDHTVVGGAFWKEFRDPNPLMLGQAFRCALRLHLGQRVVGDQAMFIRRDALNAIGGIPDMPLMEEFELCRRLNSVGNLALATATVSTSARRFAKLGVLRTYARMWYVTIRYYLGTPAHELKQIYEKE